MTLSLPLMYLAAAAASHSSFPFWATAEPQVQTVMVAPDPYLAYAATAITTLNQWYNESNGLWDSTGWWNSANCLTVVADYASIDPTYTPLANQIFQNTLSAAQSSGVSWTRVYGPSRYQTHGRDPPSLPPRRPPPPSSSSSKQQRAMTQTLDLSPDVEKLSFPDFINDFYDDEGWWALAWIRAYDVTNNTTYLSTAQSIFDDMLAGWGNTSCNGGLRWEKSMPDINAIENELFLAVAARLATRETGDTVRQTYYLNWAIRSWQWFSQTGMINAEGNVNDGIDNVTCRNDGGIVWSYNQGVILGGLVDLWRLSPNPAYVDTAVRIADAAIAGLCDKEGVLHDLCEPSCGADGEQFKGIFMRNLFYLWNVTGKETYFDTLVKNADSVWAAARNESSNRFGEVWSGPYQEGSAGSHSSATDAVIAAAKATIVRGNVVKPSFPTTPRPSGRRRTWGSWPWKSPG